MTGFLDKIILNKYFVSLIIVGAVFLWGINIIYTVNNINYNISLKFLLLILLIPAFIKFLTELKNKDYKFIKYFSFFCGFLFLHTGLNLYFDNQQITQVILAKTVLLILIFVIAYYYYKEIIKNLDLIINIFLILFLLSCFISFFNYQKDTPFFCGGIPDIFGLTYGMHDIDPNSTEYIAKLDYSKLKLSFQEYIFNENSHLGMIAPAVLAYTIFRLFKNFNKFNLITTLLFFIICLFKSSTTLLMGFSASLIGIILFNYKFIPKKVILIYLLLVTGCIYTLSIDSECKSRWASATYGNYNSLSNSIVKINENRIDGSLSSAVTFNSLRIAKESILNKPFGWGANRYVDAFNYYNKLNTKHPKGTYNEFGEYEVKTDFIEYLYSFNSSDASNNIVKMSVEFGVFVILIFLILFLYTINKSIPIEHKLFFIPFIGTQMLRGAGYFNSGFAIIIFIILLSYLNNKYSRTI